MPKIPVVISVATLLVLLFLLVFTSIGVVIVALTSWLLTLVTPLAFSQAALVAGATSVMVIYLSRRELFVSVPATLMMVLIITPLGTLSFVVVAWGLDHFSPLDFWQATLLTTGVGLAVFYGLANYLAESAFGGEDDEEWDDEEWDDEEWDDEEWDDENWEDEGEIVFRPQHHRTAKPKTEPVQALDEEAKWTTVGRNDPCPCGSGKKYKYCHGRKNK